MAETTSDIDIVIKFLQDIQGGVIASQEAKGLKASGKSARALRTAKEGDKIGQLIDGTGSLEFQEFGRRPGKYPPLDEIYAWLAFKKYGLDWKTETDRKSLSFLIARKIAQKGTHTHITQQPTGVVTDNVTPEKLELLKTLIADNNRSQILTDIKRIFT